ncbi:MAG: hypothetical protein K6E26_09095 [Clostridiales bacterium]|nr:hypothetical protein [Clostridiales bacterium]
MGSYDLLYQENQAWAESSADYPDSPFLHKMVIHPPYLIYDESWDEMICPDDADAGNTLTIYNYFALLFTRMMRQASVGDFDYNSLNPVFLNDMKEYADAVIGDKKMLGLLVRGSDYITSKMSGVSAPVSTDVIIPKVKELMKTDGFDGIFLATEDADVLETMEKAFPGILRAVSQERYRVSDFEKYQGITTISELDRERHKDDFDEFVEDTTSNYFYALYILSRCESIMYSGQCGGASMVRSMNGDRF